MKTIEIEVNLYKFDELDFVAQSRAVLEHKQFLQRVDNYVPTRDETEESLQINEYWFFIDGDMANTLAYMENNKIVKEVFQFKQKDYIL